MAGLRAYLVGMHSWDTKGSATERNPDGRPGTFDDLKRRLYTIAFSFALAGAVLGLLVGGVTGASSLFTQILLVFVILFEAASIVLIRHWKFIRVIEESSYVFLSLVMISVFAYSLYLAESETSMQNSLFSYYLWMPTIYVLIFILQDGRGALVRTILLFLLLLLVSLPYAVSYEGPEIFSSSVGYLAHHFMSTAAIIAMLYFFGSLKDRLTEAQEATAKATRLSETDQLTGLPNRRYIYNVLEKEMERSRRYGDPLSLILLDVDDFKRVNDDHGHDVGDAVLVEFADRLRSFRRSSDELGRWGGEEFIFVVPETGLQGATRLAERLRDALEEHRFGPVGGVTASFGVAAFGKEEDLASLLKRADVNLYEAKKQGKNRVTA